jgi:outer membrane protein
VIARLATLTFVLCLSPFASVAVAQPRTVTLADAVQMALDHHPSVARAHASESARRAAARATEAALYPHVDLSLELHRGTGNVVPGTQLTLPGVPAVAGPPTATQFDSGAWGSGIGAAGSYDFGAIPRRERERDAASASADAQSAMTDVTSLDIARAVAEAYVAAVHASAQRTAVAAWQERATTLVRVTETLVAQELVAGAENARATAELAAANTLAARAAQAELEALAALSSAVGDPRASLAVDPSLLGHTDSIVLRERAEHARERALREELRAAQLVREARGYAYLPQIQAVAALWARGSGLPAPSRASDLGDAAGLLPNVPNWVLGGVISFPVFDLPLLDARRDEASAAVEQAQAALDEETLALDALDAQASARVAGAREVARVAPEAVDAYRALLTQTQARYESGLATILDVVDAQRALAQAELELVTAQAAVLEALFALAYARDDLDALSGRTVH